MNKFIQFALQQYRRGACTSDIRIQRFECTLAVCSLWLPMPLIHCHSMCYSHCCPHTPLALLLTAVAPLQVQHSSYVTNCLHCHCCLCCTALCASPFYFQHRHLLRKLCALTYNSEVSYLWSWIVQSKFEVLTNPLASSLKF